MRLNEFADPKDYVPSAIDAAEDFLQQLLLICPDRPANELAPSVVARGKQEPIKRMVRSDALSIGSHVGGIHHRNRRGASQWPTA